MKVTLITSCSSTRQVQPLVKVADMPTGLTMQEALDWWIKGIKKHSDTTITPREQYRGTSFITLAKLLSDSNYEITPRIVTGGQGLLTLDESIVPYDFTANQKEEHNVLQKVTKEPFVQTVWWQMINNARYQTMRPVADLVNSTKDPVIISMPKLFLRYIAEDLMSANSLDHVRILLSSSSIGSVPAQLRSWIVPYTRDTIAHIVGNRNDGHQRAAMVFLGILASGVAINAPVSEQTSLMQGNSTTPATIDVETLRGILASRAELQKLTPDEAYTILRREHGALGGRMLFRGLFRAAQDVSIEVEADRETKDKAKAALEGLGLSAGVADSGEEEALKAVKQFVEAVREVSPNISFTAAQVCNWATTFFEGEDNIPDLLSSPNKLIHLLKANTEVLSLIATNGGKAFSLSDD